MALPTIISVRGKFVKVDGTPEKGSVTFTSKIYSLSSGDETALVPSHNSAILDTTGGFVLNLPATNDPDWTPVGWAYQVTLKFSGDYSSYNVVIPYNAPGGVIKFSDLVPAQPGGLALYASFSHTHPGFVTEASLPAAINTAIGPVLDNVLDDAISSALGDTLSNYASVSHTHAAADIVSGTIAIARLPVGVGSNQVAAGDHTHNYDLVYAPLSHVHSAANITSGVLDIARIPTGASGTTVALGNDSRFTNARTPTAHATSHASAGSDPVTLAQSQVTGLSAALTAKADTASLATVAFSGSYTDLANKPVIGDSPVASVAGRTGDVVLSKSDVSLGNVDNTSDLAKPVSTATQTALNAKANTSSLAAVALSGDYADLTNKPAASGVTSVAGRTGVVTLTKSDVALGNVDNTSDVNKPISTATQTGLDSKANTSHTHTQSQITDLAFPVTSVASKTGAVTLSKSDVSLGNVDNTADTAKPVSTAQQSALDLKAPLASPTFTGTVSGVTAAMVGLGNVSNTSDATKDAAVSTLTNKTLASPAITGTPTGLTKTHVGLANVDNTADTAKPVSTAQQTALNLKANIASPTFTGTVAGITKSMVGLSNVDNTADTAKPISTATQTALTGLDTRVTTVEGTTPTVMLWNGTSYVAAPTARIYVGPNDPGAVPNGSVWIKP